MTEHPKQPVLPGGVTLDHLAAGIVDGDRTSLARGITLVESTRSDHRRLAAELLQILLPRSGQAVRVGISGVPGVGKSTTIEQFGSNLTAQGHKVAVLAVDPSSSRSGGSILGDKTRMARLSLDENAYVRPSPSGGTLGGVAAKTRETMLLCEAAGFDVVIIETVGTGQSETAVADMVDVFVVLMLPGAGDDLQGIKKGIIERADIIAVNKSDGANERRAREAASDLQAALRILQPVSDGWTTPVLCISGLADIGLDTLWQTISDHRATLRETSGFEARRSAQQVSWMWTMIDDRLRGELRKTPQRRERLRQLEEAVRDGARAPSAAVEDMLQMIGL
ncbi:MAG: methylmalonyl Co-A mutase-associated GTPase MeaB [Pseudomonadota bacterium]